MKNKYLEIENLESRIWNRESGIENLELRIENLVSSFSYAIITFFIPLNGGTIILCWI